MTKLALGAMFFGGANNGSGGSDDGSGGNGSNSTSASSPQNSNTAIKTGQPNVDFLWYGKSNLSSSSVPNKEDCSTADEICRIKNNTKTYLMSLFRGALLADNKEVAPSMKKMFAASVSKNSSADAYNKARNDMKAQLKLSLLRAAYDCGPDAGLGHICSDIHVRSLLEKALSDQRTELTNAVLSQENATSFNNSIVADLKTPEGKWTFASETDPLDKSIAELREMKNMLPLHYQECVLPPEGADDQWSANEMKQTNDALDRAIQEKQTAANAIAQRKVDESKQAAINTLWQKIDADIRADVDEAINNSAFKYQELTGN